MTSAEHEPGPTNTHPEADSEQPTETQRRPAVATIAVGTVMIAADQVREGVRTVRFKTFTAAIGLLDRTRDRAEQAQARVRAAVGEAERRGRDTIDGRRQDASDLMDTTVSGAVGWAQVNVMPQLIDDLVPHLISDVVPRLIDGALPEIKARVIPALIDDLTNDPRVRELILAQSRGVLGQVTEQIRTGTTRADDRVEVAAHRVFGRNDKGNNIGKGAHDTRGA
jgi:hypothetical protein